MNKIHIMRIAAAFIGWIGSVSAAAADDGLAAWRAGDRSGAIAIWRELAAHGDAEASLFLGYVYRNGIGAGRDDGQAADWYRYAAERGFAEAQYELGLMYELGLGVPQDSDEAAHWYGLSAAQACPGELRAGGRLGER